MQEVLLKRVCTTVHNLVTIPKECYSWWCSRALPDPWHEEKFSEIGLCWLEFKKMWNNLTEIYRFWDGKCWYVVSETSGTGGRISRQEIYYVVEESGHISLLSWVTLNIPAPGFCGYSVVEYLQSWEWYIFGHWNTEDFRECGCELEDTLVGSS